MSLKLNLGSGNQKLSGFTNIDLYDDAADIKCDIAELPFDDESVDEIVSFQTIEHIPYHRTKAVFDEMFRVLKKGGTAVLECPDLDEGIKGILEDGLTQKWINHFYGEYHRPWDVERYGETAIFWPGAIHYQGFNFGRIDEFAMDAGFTKIRRRELHEMLDYYRSTDTLSVEITK